MNFPAQSASFSSPSLVLLHFVLLYTTQTSTLRKEASKIQTPNFQLLQAVISVLKLICVFKCIPGSVPWSCLWGANFEPQTAQQGKTVQQSRKRFSYRFFLSWMFRGEGENTGRAPPGLGAPSGAGGGSVEPRGQGPPHRPRGVPGGTEGSPAPGPGPGMAEPGIPLPRAG